jgi:hypothetical protein
MKQTRASGRTFPAAAMPRGAGGPAAWKCPVTVIAALLLLAPFSGCQKNETHRKYTEARDELKRLDPRFPDQAACERLEGVFKSIGDYKDSRELYNEVVCISGDAFLKKGDYYAGQAYGQFRKAGHYKDADKKALAASLAWTNRQLGIAIRSADRPAAAAAVFNKLDDAHKSENAGVILQYALKGIAGYFAEKGKKSTGFYQLDYHARFLDAIKGHADAPDDVREKLYNEVASQFSDRDFWRPDSGYTPRQTAVKILGFFGDYKDSKDLLRSCGYGQAWTYPVIKAEELEAQPVKAGAHPQPRTISVVVAHDGRNRFAQGEFNDFCWEIKYRSAGSECLSDNVENACAIIYYKISHSFWRSFDYSGGTKVDYYHTSLVMELQAPGGNVLYAKTFSKEWDAPMKEIGAMTHLEPVANICAILHPGEESITELLKALEAHFDGMQTDPE